MLKTQNAARFTPKYCKTTGIMVFLNHQKIKKCNKYIQNNKYFDQDKFLVDD